MRVRDLCILYFCPQKLRHATSIIFIILISYVGIETMYSVNVSQVATVSFEGVISDIGSKDPLSFATVQLLHGDEVHSVLSKDNGVFSFPSVHPGDYILRITYVGYDRYENGLH